MPNKFCWRCPSGTGHTLVRTRIADGSWQARKRCRGCGGLFDGPVSQKTIEMDVLDEYALGYKNPPCARCGHPDTQLHHYMPQTMACKAGINPDDWPTEYLCSTHHDQWHKLVTPGLVKRIANGETRKWEAPKP